MFNNTTVIYRWQPNYSSPVKAFLNIACRSAIIGEITDDDKEVFEYRGQTVATIPNKPSKEILESLKGGN